MHGCHSTCVWSVGWSVGWFVVIPLVHRNRCTARQECVMSCTVTICTNRLARPEPTLYVCLLFGQFCGWLVGCSMQGSSPTNERLSDQPPTTRQDNQRTREMRFLVYLLLQSNNSKSISVCTGVYFYHHEIIVEDMHLRKTGTNVITTKI